MESIKDAKIKIDKDLISIEAEQTTSDEVETLVKEMSDLMQIDPCSLLAGLLRSWLLTHLHFLVTLKTMSTGLQRR